MKLSDYRGKVAVLNFASHEYCGVCRASYPFERSLVERLKARPFVFLGVECDVHRDAVRKARDGGEITWRCWWDGGSIEGPIATRWNVKGWPTIFIIDHKGVIRYKGLVTDAMAIAVDALLKERDQENAQGSGACAARPDRARPASHHRIRPSRRGRRGDPEPGSAGCCLEPRRRLPAKAEGAAAPDQFFSGRSDSHRARSTRRRMTGREGISWCNWR